MVWRLPTHPAQAARCARTGDQQTTIPLPLPPQRPPMPIPFQQRIRFAWSPAPGSVEVDGFFAGQQRVIEAPSRFSEIRADEESLIADHHVAKQCLVGFGERAKRFFIVEM